MSDLVDLHVHSNKSSDGDFPPEALVGFAAEKGLRAISIVDHDTVAAYPESLEAGSVAGVEVVPGLEVTTLFAEREFHVLLFFVDWSGSAVRDIVAGQTRRRLDEARERVEKLRRLGLAVSWEEVREKTQDLPPLGVKIAQIVLESPANRSNPGLEHYYREENRAAAPYMFYREFFAEGKAAFVPKAFIGLSAVLDMAVGTQGVAVLAHPGAHFMKATRADVRALKKRGLDGLEVYTSYHTPEQVEFYEALAGDFGLVPTAGSDFHGRIKPHVEFGALREGRYWMVERLRERKERRS